NIDSVANAKVVRKALGIPSSPSSEVTFLRILISLYLHLAHDLFRKPVSTFRDHALIWRNAEGARDAREPVGKNLCRLARGFQFEEEGVDPDLEPRLVLLDAEAGRAWQFIIGNQGKVLRHVALLRERQEQHLVGQETVHLPFPQCREAGRVIVEMDD